MSKQRVTMLVVVLCSAVLSGCAGLAGEPLIVRTQPVETVTPTPLPDRGAPAERISLADGATLYQGAQGCQNCHGAGGAGNGPTAASFTCKIMAFSDPVNGSKTLASWFAITTNGNGGATTCLMPAWKNRYTEQQRWNVTSYVYSLRYTTETMKRGGELFAANCLSCHGTDGSGANGSENATVPSLHDPARLADSSDAMLISYLGSGQAGHTFGNLGEADRLALVAHARALAWDNTEIIGSAIALGTPGVAVAGPSESPTLTVSGTVTSGTTGQALPPNMPITLRVIQRNEQGSFTDLLRQESPVTLDGNNVTGAVTGSYSFRDVPRTIGAVYVVSATVGGITQTSTPQQLVVGSGDLLKLDLNVFSGAISDPARIQVEALRTFVDFVAPGVAYVQQGMRFTNISDQLFYSTRPDGTRQSVAIELPRGATDLQLSTASSAIFRVEQASDVIRLISAIPVIPGEGLTLQYAFRVPYPDGEALQYAQVMPYLVDQSSVHVGFTSGGTVSTVGYAPGEPLNLDSGSYRTFNNTRTIAVGGLFAFEVLFPAQIAADRQAVTTVVLLAAFGLITVTGIVLWRSRT